MQIAFQSSEKKNGGPYGKKVIANIYVENGKILGICRKKNICFETIILNIGPV